jgi:hypothetical protein
VSVTECQHLTCPLGDRASQVLPCDSSTSGTSDDLARVLLPNCACFQLRAREIWFTLPHHIGIYAATTRRHNRKPHDVCKKLKTICYQFIYIYGLNQKTRPASPATSITVTISRAVEVGHKLFEYQPWRGVSRRSLRYQSWSGVRTQAVWDISGTAQLGQKLFKISVRSGVMSDSLWDISCEAWLRQKLFEVSVVKLS